MRISVLLSCIILTATKPLLAQNAYVNLGRQALLDGDFRSAARHLERACVVDSSNADALWMLGYSYYHNQAYKKAVAAYSKVIGIKPADFMAYYYRARAKGYMAKDMQVAAAEKEKWMLGAIIDFTKALEIAPNDTKIYQNRGIAYREYGLFKLQSNKPSDRSRGINSLRASIADLERILNDNPSRTDIDALLSLSKEKLAAAEGHR